MNVGHELGGSNQRRRSFARLRYLDNGASTRHVDRDPGPNEAPMVGTSCCSGGASAARLSDTRTAFPHRKLDRVGRSGMGSDELNVDSVGVMRLEVGADCSDVDEGRIVYLDNEVRVTQITGGSAPRERIVQDRLDNTWAISQWTHFDRGLDQSVTHARDLDRSNAAVGHNLQRCIRTPAHHLGLGQASDAVPTHLGPTAVGIVQNHP